MPVLETINFGPIFFLPESVFEFPRGLPGFEDRRRFLPVQNPATAPVIFLQSLEEPTVCFTTIPVRVVDPGYCLRLTDEDRDLLDWTAGRPPDIGEDVLCLSVLAIRESGTTANLLAPVVVNLRNRKAVQAVAADSEYSHRHDLFAPKAQPCS